MHQASEIGGILSGLGNSADEIANTLRTAGVQGVRNTVRFLNPIVRYCQIHLLVDNYALDMMLPGILRIHIPDGHKDIPLPQPVTEFLEAFDQGRYADLELPT